MANKGCPEWGALFRDIERDGLSVGLELARLLMEQSTSRPTGQRPPAAMHPCGDLRRRGGHSGPGPGTTYVRWIGWVWRGHVAEVIAELAVRQQELVLPAEEDGEMSVRRIVSEALTYLQNQSGKMNDPEYRRQGLPITSSHVESAILSRR